MKNQIANILGTKYTIITKPYTEDKRLENNLGITDFFTKEIYLRDDIEEETDDSSKNLVECKKKVIRHEILHAFLYESGLHVNSNGIIAWAENEEMVDWFAIQFPKIYKIYEELDLL